MEKTYEVVGIGHALVDTSFSVSEEFLLQQGLPKGQMTLCDKKRFDALRAALPVEAESLSAAGSCSNTLALLGRLNRHLKEHLKESLGLRVAFLGRVGCDEAGEDFRRSMEQSGVECRLEGVSTEAEEAEEAEGAEGAEGAEATGQCLALVTKDAQRTFATHLGISSNIAARRLDEALLHQARYLYLEGYLLGGEQGEEVFQTAAAVSRKRASCVLSLSLSDPSCVGDNRDFLLRFVRSEVELLFANEEEGRRLFALSQTLAKEEAREQLVRCCAALGCRVCLTLGAEGALLFDGSKGEMSVAAPKPPTRCVDTTGAGDAFAAGMLFGLSQGWSLKRAGELANALGGAVVGEVGPRLSAEPQHVLNALGEESLAP